jgi:hypothetical protein
MDAFTQTFGGVLALCLGIIILTVFFKTLGYLGRLWSGAETTVIKSQSFVAEKAIVKVFLKDGEILDSVTFLGFSQTSTSHRSPGQGLPFELNKMAVFANPDGTKIFVAPKAINSIHELPLK